MTHISALPDHIIERIFGYLAYKDLDKVRCVCWQFHAAGVIAMKTGIETVLHQLAHKLSVLEAELMESYQCLDHKIILNQTYTTLKLLRMHVYSLYVLRRHFRLAHCHFRPFGAILDNITIQLRQMKSNNCLTWLRHCLRLQGIISRFNIYKGHISGNLIYPFGVHVIDILDVLTGINYDIKCIYNFKENSCSVFAYYYTENIKFLTYMPDINFIKDCQDRYLTKDERTSILKYLLALVNLYNGLHGKKEEYEREMQFGCDENISFVSRHPLETHHCRNVAKREYLSNSSVLEMYVNEHTKQKALLGCRVELICSMDLAPFKITKSLELLKRDLYLNNSSIILHNQSETSVNYAVEINLRFVVKQKMQELFDISIKDIGHSDQ